MAKKRVFVTIECLSIYRHARIMGDITMDAHLVVTIHNTNTVARQASIKRFLSQRLTLF